MTLKTQIVPYEGRLWDVLNVLRFAISNVPAHTTELLFTVAFLIADDSLQDTRLKSVCGPGDVAEPVITIMLPDED